MRLEWPGIARPDDSVELSVDAVGQRREGLDVLRRCNPDHSRPPRPAERAERVPRDIEGLKFHTGKGLLYRVELRVRSFPNESHGHVRRVISHPCHAWRYARLADDHLNR